MSFKFQVSEPKLKFYFLLFAFSLFAFGCGGSVPNLESPACDEARQNVKALYSYHFDNEMKPSAESLKLHERYITKTLFANLAAQNEAAFDYFTQTDDYPKTFRIGACESAADDKTKFQVHLFWKDDNRNEERKINVESVKENGKWLVNKVEK